MLYSSSSMYAIIRGFSSFSSEFGPGGTRAKANTAVYVFDSTRGAMSNINGKVYAMNAITPMKPWKTWILRAAFFVLGHVKPLQKDLIDLSFIEFARWVVVPRGDLQIGR